MTEILASTNSAPHPRTAAAKSAPKRTKTLPVEPKTTIWNPEPDELRRYTEAMPNAKLTEFNNLNVGTRVVSRSKLSTFIATDHKEEHSDQTISRAEYARIAKLQDDYITTREMLVIEGFIGNDPEFRVATRLIIEKSNANIAAMFAFAFSMIRRAGVRNSGSLPMKPSITTMSRVRMKSFCSFATRSYSARLMV